MTTPDNVLSFWFDVLASAQHFERAAEVDAEIAKRFTGLHAQLARNVPLDWTATPLATLATVIVLDQFSRNIFRDQPHAYSQDGLARSIANAAITRGDDMSLAPQKRQFVYMPLMYSEQLPDVERCAALMRASGIEQGEDFAFRHASVLQRFGRYPARNEALARDTTPEEAQFLKGNPLGF